MRGRPRLVYRLYLIALLGVFALAASWLAAFFIVFRRSTDEYEGRLAWHVAARQVAVTEGVEPPRLPEDLRSRVALYDAAGKLMGASGADPLPFPGAAVRAQVPASGVLRHDDTWLVRVPDQAQERWAVVATRVPRFAAINLIPGIAAVLILVSIATFWYARRLARPLEALARAADEFGRGDTSVRARLDREDELGAVGRAFDGMADRIAALLVAQRQLLADVSHELRTPLARIRVALDVTADDPASAREMLGEVRADLAELERMVDDVLTAAKLDLGDGGVPGLRHDRFALAGVLARAAERFRARHPAATLRESNGVELPELDGDEMLLRRALENLLDNAAKHGGGGPIELEVASTPGEVLVSVVDHGPGLSAEDAALAFTPFWRSDRSRTRGTGGVGLGLALARRICRAHGGDVELAKTPGGGLTARMRLPG